MALGSIYRHYIILSFFLLLLMYAAYTCLVVFTCRCADLIRFICTSYRLYGFYSAVGPAVQLLPPKLIFEPGICFNALLPFCYMPHHPLPRILRWPFAMFITYPALDIFKNLWKRHVFLFLVLFHPCYLLPCSPCTLSVCLVYRICRNIYSLSIHFCSLCFVLFCFVLLHLFECLNRHRKGTFCILVHTPIVAQLWGYACYCIPLL
nr:MAG TPA: hypothetical protein [Caudoviricetes sp.]